MITGINYSEFLGRVAKIQDDIELGEPMMYTEAEAHAWREVFSCLANEAMDDIAATGIPEGTFDDMFNAHMAEFEELKASNLRMKETLNRLYGPVWQTDPLSLTAPLV